MDDPPALKAGSGWETPDLDLNLSKILETSREPGKEKEGEGLTREVRQGSQS